MKKDIIKELHKLITPSSEEDKNWIDELAMYEAEGDAEESEVDEVRYTKIVDLLHNDLINNAAVAEALWGSKDDTHRSKFRKKLEREANEYGSIQQFTEEEVGRIETILITLSNDIGSKIESKKKKKK